MTSELVLMYVWIYLYVDYTFRYNKSSKSGKMGYEDDFLRFLQGLISDVEKRIRRGHQRLALNNSQGSVSILKLNRSYSQS